MTHNKPHTEEAKRKISITNMQLNPGVRNEVKEIRHLISDATLQQIGDLVGVSRERVRQILSSEGLKTRSAKLAGKEFSEDGKKVICPNCGSSRLNKQGIIWSGRTRKKQFKCINCGRSTVNPNYTNKNNSEGE